MTRALIETIVSSPVGPLRLVASDDALVAVEFAKDGGRRDSHPILDQAADELSRYFAGALKAFSTPLAPPGTPFQRSVWNALQEIPYGETRSYAQLAQAIGKPGASRAVGSANGANPLAIVIPCHRVIASGGGLGGYGGGLDKKRWLLALERVDI